MFKSFVLYRVGPEWNAPTAADLDTALRAAPFVPCAPTQRESAGWVSPRPEADSPLVEGFGGHLLMKLASQSRRLPAAAVKEALAQRMAQLEAQTGRKVRGRAKKDLKEEVELDLLPRAFAQTRTTLVWLDTRQRLLYVGAGSQKVADQVTTALVQAVEGQLPLALVRTQLSAATAMALWLSSRDAPSGFSVDRECVLQQLDEGGASVRYSRHALDGDDIVQHLASGKVPTQLALTWRARVSFVLTDTLQVKRLSVLGVEGAGDKGAAAEGADSGFDADTAIVTAELPLLVADLLEALGGEPDARE